MSRWKYKVETVTVGENSQKVRQMTTQERKQFAQASKEIKNGERRADELPGMIAEFGCTDPQLMPEEIADMPADLLDACVSKIMDLSGFKDEEKKTAVPDPEEAEELDLPTPPDQASPAPTPPPQTS